MSEILPSTDHDYRRIYYVYSNSALSGTAAAAPSHDPDSWSALCAHASSLGFDSMMVSPLWSTTERGQGAPDDPDKSQCDWLGSTAMTDIVAGLAAVCTRHRLRLIIDLVLDKVVRGGAAAVSEPSWYEDSAAAALDPRHELQIGLAHLRCQQGRAPAGFVEAWGRRLHAWARAGAAGFRCCEPALLAADDWRELIGRARSGKENCRFMAWTPGLVPAQLAKLAGAGFDAVFSSLPWWDYRSTWLIDEHARLRPVAPVISPVTDPAGPDVRAGADAAAWRRLWVAAMAGSGVLLVRGTEEAIGAQAVAQMNRWAGARPASGERLRIVSGPMAPATVLFRDEAGLIINPSAEGTAALDWRTICSRLPEGCGDIKIIARCADQDADAPRDDSASASVAMGGEDARTSGPQAMQPVASLAAGECVLFEVAPAESVGRVPATVEQERKSVAAALRAPRIAIENVTPAVDGGRFPIKRVVGEPVQVEADAYMDGHDHIAVRLLWRAADESAWREVPMNALGNDRWQAQFIPLKKGRHCYTIRAWRDNWDSFRDQLKKKVAVNQDVSLEAEEGRVMLRAALNRVAGGSPALAETLERLLAEIGEPQAPPRALSRRARAGGAAAGQAGDPIARTVPGVDPAQIQHLLSDTAAAAMRAADARQFETTCEVIYPLTVERRAAVFASWYELFPRSYGPAPGVHGRFKDVVRRLPAIRDMGFDVLYFPPIHPIGMRNRKGRNNALVAEPGDPGSPYAIGSGQGGHDAVHPELGSLDDFRQLLECARGHGLEIALDFAIQCSPDHPWLKEHPEWFAWRADGSLRYAENPPKRYEDIVNPDFYSTAVPASRQSGLWRQLRDVILFWVGQGVRIFRVDNPHTKPLPFWQWLIAEVQAAHPDTLFLSEAFTRPKMMYRLAKVGFSQSYTYFTWRNHKQELIEYLSELNTPPVADFFRPNFFVNTPDINPYFLQTSGRAGFLIRAALAATTSGLWGVYSGFELCEARALPGKEEYLDSEKYQLRAWDWDRPGNIIAEIAQLNQIRRTNPALQTHLGIRFHRIDDEQLLFFSKSTREGDNMVLVVISLDPHAPRSGTLELPLWERGLPDDGVLHLEDLCDGRRFSMPGKYHRVELTPQRPFLLWRVVPPA